MFHGSFAYSWNLFGPSVRPTPIAHSHMCVGVGDKYGGAFICYHHQSPGSILTSTRLQLINMSHLLVARCIASPPPPRVSPSNVSITTTPTGQPSSSPPHLLVCLSWLLLLLCRPYSITVRRGRLDWTWLSNPAINTIPLIRFRCGGQHKTGPTRNMAIIFISK